MKYIKEIAWLFAAGVIIMCGLRTAEWVIPAPDMRIVVCQSGDNGDPMCASLAEIRERIEAAKGDGQ